MRAEILIVDDDPKIALTLSQQLDALGYHSNTAADGGTARRTIGEKECSLILLDLALPDTTGIELLKTWKGEGLTVPVVMISGTATIPDAVEAMKLGAADFLVKPVDMRLLEAVVKRTLNAQALRTENARLRQLAGAGDVRFLGESNAVTALLAQADRMAAGDHPILLEGETGTGKQVLARYIHLHSERSTEPFVSVNCAAITETLFESELFGHEKGAFTGAFARKPGKFELVGRGTLFLDEIGELPVLCQAKLLTAVEDRVFERVGGVRTLPFEGRVIAATNRDLESEIRKGTFRRDLFFRLNTFHLKLPPLRSRAEDVPIYVNSALETCRRKHGHDFKSPDEETTMRLQAYPWPGNVRELMHHVERVVLMSDSPTIPRTLWLSFPTAQIEMDSEEESVPDLRVATEAYRKKHILRVVASCGGNQTEAAKRLGIERTHLNRLLAEFEGRRG